MKQHNGGVSWLAVLLVFVIQVAIVSVWAGRMDARMEALEKIAQKIVDEGIDDRWRETDDVERMDKHLEREH